jgi:DNA-binding HxlR family transcriptional regulator
MSECVYVDAVRALKRIKGRWKTPILAALAEEPRRWSDLRRLFPAMTPKMMAQQLDELERDGVLVREEYVASAPKVVIYSLSPLGERVRPLLAALVDWGREVAAHSAEEAERRGEAARPTSRDSMMELGS